MVNIAGGTISNNTSEGNGGGLSLGVSRVSENDFSTLDMTGGTFEGNVANDSGGGLFVQGGTGEGYSRATISGGHFTGNTARGGFFGGGGIYVNGGHNWPGFVSGKLYLINALVTGNDAGENGGGYAACPTSNTEISVKNGAAFYGNDAPSGKELHINANVVWHGATAQPDYEISDSMLGGAPYHWSYDDGTEVPLSSLSGKLPAYNELNLNNSVTDETAAPARELATVFIEGNHAGMRGGGIGSNGDVYIGTSDLVEVTVDKTWNDNDDAAGKRPGEIKVGLYRSIQGSGDEPVYIGYNKVKPDDDGNWSVTFAKLPKSNQDGKLFVYTVKELFDKDDPLPYGSESTGSVSGENGTIKLTNTYDTVNVSGEKTWDDGNNQDGVRPDAITVKLLANGIEVEGQVKTVTAADGWKWTFDDLPKYSNGTEIKYAISEDAVEGYETNVSEDGFSITNVHIPATVDVSGSKTWKDDDDKAGARPKSITVRLFANGEEVQNKTVTKKDGWKWTFGGLPKFKDGKEIAYTVSEDEVAGYKTVVEGFDITNTYAPTPNEPTPPGDNTTPNPKGSKPPAALGRTPRTGDVVPLALLAGILVASVALGIYSLRAKKRNE